jgi:hypothetical protein
MTISTAMTEAIQSLGDVESRFNLRRTKDIDFFRECSEDLPELTELEKESLDLIRHRYLYHLSDGYLTEGTVILLLGAPLLEKAGFYDEPFKIRGEASVKITIDNDHNEREVLKGRIDILVLNQSFWVTLLESKRTAIAVNVALPQTLAYMMANPHQNQPVFAMIINGDGIMFVKLCQQETPQYDLSRIFSPIPLKNELYDVLKILKRIGQTIHNRHLQKSS